MTILFVESGIINDCDLCGITYRITDTQLNDAGLRVCKHHDVDVGHYRHPSIFVSTAAPIVVVSGVELNTDGIITQGFWDISSITGMDIITGGLER